MSGKFLATYSQASSTS